jgi:putative glutamine amidotransferase
MPTNRRPLVGITATVTRVREGEAPPIDAAVVDAAYLDAVRGAGLLPVVLPPADPADADAALDVLDALILTGGEDVDPAHYGERAHPAAGPFTAPRDAWELALARAAHARRVPTLAICRGVQLLNVALGGTLTQHLGDDAACGARHGRMADRRCRVHALAVAPNSPLARALGVSSLAVNSYHHQAVARVAPPLAGAAWSDDGVVEALVARDDAWPVLGVQWHPEDLVHDAEPWDRRLFAWLARRAQERT